MRLTKEAHVEIEEFLRRYFGDPGLRLPVVKVVGGGLARRLTKSLNIGAITVGRRIVVSPTWLKRDDDGRWTMPGWLLAHEGAHVAQYRRDGLLKFLYNYLREYVSFMRARGWDAAAHKDAYRNLSAEIEARAAEEAYKEFLKGRVSDAGEVSDAAPRDTHVATNLAEEQGGATQTRGVSHGHNGVG